MLDKLLFSLLTLLGLLSNGQQAEKKKTILFIGAHPDDETAISEMLNKYARLGNKVFVMIATDGNQGTRVTKIPAGDSLGDLRKKETICSCKALGLEPPIFLGIERLDTRIGVSEYFEAHQQFLDSLKIKIPLIDPDVIITAGPDGDTHHSEHIVVGAAVTELLLAEGWVEKFPLYHFAWPKGTDTSDNLPYMDKKYFNVKVAYTSENEDRAIAALNCYVTQNTPDELREEAERKRKDTVKTVYFRKFVVLNGIKNEF